MAAFRSAEEVHRVLGAVFKRGLENPGIAAQLADVGVVLKINYRDPSAIVIVDMRNQRVYEGTAEGVVPTVELFMSADTGNRFWQGQLRPAVALATGQIKTKGATSACLKSFAAAKALFPVYRAMLISEGRQDLVLA